MDVQNRQLQVKITELKVYYVLCIKLIDAIQFQKNRSVLLI